MQPSSHHTTTFSWQPASDPQAQQPGPLHLPDDAVAARLPLIRDLALVNSRPQHPAGGPVLHERARLGLGDGADVEHPQPRALHDAVGARVVQPAEGVARRQLRLGDALLARELAVYGELHAGVAGRVGAARCADDGAAAGEGGLAGEQVGEHAHDGEVVRVDRLEGRAAVVRDPHGEGEAVQGEEQRGPRAALALERELVPQGGEYGPGLVGLTSRLDQRVERGAMGDGVGELLVGAGGIDTVQHGTVRGADVLHQLEGVDGLHPLLGVGVGDGGVVGACGGQFLSYKCEPFSQRYILPSFKATRLYEEPHLQGC